MRQIDKLTDRLRGHRPSLVPAGVWDEALDRDIAALAESEADDAVKAGLHLWNESLDRSHTLSQSIEDRTGSYWHGIMHRMEPDYDNSRYWFHRVHDHPAFPLVLRAVRDYAAGARALERVADEAVRSRLRELTASARWQPFLFIEAVERHMRGGGRDADTAAVLEDMQRLEIECLLNYCAGGVPGSRS